MGRRMLSCRHACIKRALDEVASLANDLKKESHNQVIQSQLFKRLNKRFEEFVDHLRKTNGPLLAFWMSYIDMVELMLHVVQASREGHCTLHLSCVRQMLPWCFAYHWKTTASSQASSTTPT